MAVYAMGGAAHLPQGRREFGPGPSLSCQRETPQLSLPTTTTTRPPTCPWLLRETFYFNTSKEAKASVLSWAVPASMALPASCPGDVLPPWSQPHATLVRYMEVTQTLQLSEWGSFAFLYPYTE